MIAPKRLQKGDVIGFVGPSGAIRKPNALVKAVQLMHEWCYKVKLGESAGQQYGYLSGSDEVRARDVNAMFADGAVDAIFCLCGGYGTARILPLLDAEVARKNPKIFLGYSDITAMHTFYNELSGLITFHGPMPTSDLLNDDYDAFSHQSLMRALTEPQLTCVVHNPPGHEMSCLNPGQAEGILAGGNLTLVAASVGTPYALDPRGKILLLEDIGELTYSLDGMLTQLRNAGTFDACAGIIFGDFRDCVIEYAQFGLTLEEIIRDIVAPCGKPIIMNLRAGHCTPVVTLPLGVKCTMDAGARQLTLLESAVS